MMACVIGSGPAGVSVAHALLEQGVTVSMVDAGIGLEKSRADKLNELKNTSYATWDKQTLEFFRSEPHEKKLAYGSDFPYQENKFSIPLSPNDVDISTSLALGGLSNVWGAAVLPYRACDISDWPITDADLAPHFRAVLKFMPIAAEQDDLKNEFPIFAEDYRPLRPSKQAQSLESHFRAHRGKLETAGIQFGHARLAVNAFSSSEVEGCTYCGMCLHGCPNQLIYNSAFSVEALKSKPKFQYVGDTIVDSLSELNGSVNLYCRSARDGSKSTVTADRVYVAGGALGSAKIILKSLNAYGHSLSLKDSQYFGFPILRWDSVKDVMREPMHTMAQLFLEIQNPALAHNPAHLQIYTYNDVFRDQLKKRLGPLKGIEPLVANRLYGRLFFANGYLHSSDSSSISVCLEGDERQARLELRSNMNPIALKVAQRLVKSLAKLRFLRITPLAFMMIFGKPGKSNHVGGTFPMRHKPGAFETDIYGRVSGFKKVHIVDSSIFPSVPATTITLNVMANAHRIGSLVRQVCEADR